jgi:uncharacterized protein YjbJ (UPF0337 family)
MNREEMLAKWHRFKGEAKIQWGRLTDDDLEQINGNAEKFIGVLQERYGYVRERAAREIEQFRRQYAQTPDLQTK